MVDIADQSKAHEPRRATETGFLEILIGIKKWRCEILACELPFGAPIHGLHGHLAFGT
jgi:hypothetical protein